MLTYLVDIRRDPDALYVAELRVQCVLAQQAYEHLVEYSVAVDKNNNARERDGNSPSVVIAHCVGFLSAVAVISKILFPVKRNSVNRGQRLRTRLDLANLPGIEARSVRNSYEHIDEKVDELRISGTAAQVCLMDISVEAPDPPVVLKRFDPVSRKIEFLGDKLDLETCYAEVVRVERALNSV